MKGYDFSRKRSTPDKKDKQWDWIDEEFRRIWDVLYNKREIYPDQVPPVNNIPSPQKLFLENKNFAYLHGMGNSRAAENGLFSAVGSFLSLNFGSPVQSVGSGSNTTATDIDEAFNFCWLTTATTLDNTTSIHLGGGTASEGNFFPAHLPKAVFIIKTHSAISDRIIHLGLAGTANITTAAVAAGSEHLPNTVSGAFYNAFTLFFKPTALGGSGTSNNWQVCHRYQTQTANLVDTGVLVEANKVYIIEIEFTREVRTPNLIPELGYKYNVTINGNLVFSTYATSPSGSNLPDPALNISTIGRKYVTTVWERNKTAGTVRALGVHKVFVEWAYPLVNNDKTNWNDVFGFTPI